MTFSSARTGGRILVDQLLAQGCDRIFTVPGESFLAVLDALHDMPRIDLVAGRREGGVGFMACADGALPDAQNRLRHARPGRGVPAANAAALRYPDRTVVALAGDGCFLMNGQELATAVSHGATMLVLVIDNGAYGTIRMHQERKYSGRVIGTVLRNPDFAALGRAYGCWAETVETTTGFATALARAIAQPGVKLLHLKTYIEQITAGTTLAAMKKTAPR